MAKKLIIELPQELKPERAAKVERKLGLVFGAKNIVCCPANVDTIKVTEIETSDGASDND